MQSVVTEENLQAENERLKAQLEVLKKALVTIADEPCLWLEENFNHDMTCPRQSPPDDGEIYNSESWCSVCIAKATIEKCVGPMPRAQQERN